MTKDPEWWPKPCKQAQLKHVNFNLLKTSKTQENKETMQ
jgi:hypothetical protein